MTVEELINELQKLEDKTLDVRLEYKDEEANEWVERVLERVEAHYQGGSGYELHGEGILIASEQGFDFFIAVNIKYNYRQN